MTVIPWFRRSWLICSNSCYSTSSKSNKHKHKHRRKHKHKSKLGRRLKHKHKSKLSRRFKTLRRGCALRLTRSQLRS